MSANYRLAYLAKTDPHSSCTVSLRQLSFLLKIIYVILLLQWSAASIPHCHPTWRCHATVTSWLLAVTIRSPSGDWFASVIVGSALSAAVPPVSVIFCYNLLKAVARRSSTAIAAGCKIFPSASTTCALINNW